MSRHYIMVITDADPADMEERFRPQVGEALLRVRTLEDVEDSLPQMDGVIIDADHLRGSDNGAALCEFLCAVRYRAIYHHKLVVAVTALRSTAHLAESEKMVAVGDAREAVDLVLSWTEAQAKRGDYRELIASTVDSALRKAGFRSDAASGPRVEQVDGLERCSRREWSQRPGATPESRIVEPESSANQLEGELAELALLAVDGRTKNLRAQAREMAMRISARLEGIP